MGYNSIAWLPLCAGLTVLGLVLSYFAGRRRGSLAMMRGVAWSLLPIAAYLTGSVEMFWKIGAAIGHYADGFVFSPVKWAGIAVAGLAALIFFTTSGRERRRAARLTRRGSGDKTGESGSSAITRGTGHDMDISQILSAAKAPAAKAPASKTSATPASQPKASSKASSKGKAKGSAPDDDMSDIEDILRKRGI
jgi:hypothetical protein